MVELLVRDAAWAASSWERMMLLMEPSWGVADARVQRKKAPRAGLGKMGMMGCADKFFFQMSDVRFGKGMNVCVA